MEFYGFKQHESYAHDLSVDEYKEKFLCLHKYAPHKHVQIPHGFGDKGSAKVPFFQALKKLRLANFFDRI